MQNERPGLPNFSVSPKTNFRKTHCKSVQITAKEFGFYFSLDAGKNWTELTGGLPTAVCIKDIAIQKEENDIVLASFGRGFFVLDDYSLLQNIKAEDLNKTACIFPIKDGLVFIPSSPYGHRGKSFQGESFYTAANPPIGANITFNIKDDWKSIKDTRVDAEKEKIKNNKDVFYPSADSIRLEDNHEAAYILAVITDEQNNEIRKYKFDAKKGMKKFTWDGRYEVTSPINFNEPDLIAKLKNTNPKGYISYADQLAWLQRSKAGNKIDITCLRVGDVRMLHLPGELFIEYQLAAKAMRPDLHVMMAAYGNYGPGYIGTAAAYPEGGYETGPTASSVAPEVEPVLMGAMRNLLGVK